MSDGEREGQGGVLEPQISIVISSYPQLINPLFEYLTENLTTLGNHLLPSVFERYILSFAVHIILFSH